MALAVGLSPCPGWKMVPTHAAASRMFVAPSQAAASRRAARALRRLRVRTASSSAALAELWVGGVETMPERGLRGNVPMDGPHLA